MENVLSFNRVISLVDDFCVSNSCSGYEALRHLKKKGFIELKDLTLGPVFEKDVRRKKLEKIEDSLAFIKAMNEMDALRLGSAEEFTKSPRIK